MEAGTGGKWGRRDGSSWTPPLLCLLNPLTHTPQSQLPEVVASLKPLLTQASRLIPGYGASLPQRPGSQQTPGSTGLKEEVRRISHP